MSERNAIVAEYLEVLNIADIHRIIGLGSAALIIILLRRRLLLIRTLIAVILLVRGLLLITALVTALLLRLACKRSFVYIDLGNVMFSTVFIIIGAGAEISDYGDHSAFAEIAIYKLCLLAPCYAGDEIGLTFFALADKAAVYRNRECEHRNAARSSFKLQIARDSAHENNFIQHDLSSFSALCARRKEQVFP